MEQPINQFDSTPRNNPVLLPIIIAVILTAIIVGSGIYWWANQKQIELNNEIVSLRTQVYQLKQASIPTPIQTIPPTPQQPTDTSTNSEESNGGTKINQTTVYKNTVLGFQMTFPTGWYLPSASDGDPHAYSCPNYYCELALEVQDHDYFADKNFDEMLSESKKEDPNAKEIVSFINGARVIKMNAPGGAEGWSYEYDIIFYGKKKGFLIFTDSEKLESAILPSFKLLQ